MRYSRATMAQWLRMPPVSDTTALAVENRGVQAGMVMSHTRMSPAWTLLASGRLCTTFARPCTVPGEALVPMMTSGARLGSGGIPSILLRTAFAKGASLGGGGARLAGCGVNMELARVAA